MHLPVYIGYGIKPLFFFFLLINLRSPAFQACWTKASSDPAGHVQTDTASPAESKVLPAVFTACLCPAALGEDEDTLSPAIRQYAGTILALSE